VRSVAPQEEAVERAFVHVDYEYRDFNEHEELYQPDIPISDQHIGATGRATGHHPG
jgi:hypothetical protein